MKHTAAMGRAMDAVRASNPLKATRLIQQALQGSEHQEGHSPNASTSQSGGPELKVFSCSHFGQLQGNQSSLAETIAALRALKTPLGGCRPHPDPIPESAGFARRTYSCGSGRRDFRLLVPSSTRPQGLVVMLHGCKQTADDFAVGTDMNKIAEEHALLVAYPDQPASANPSSCWNWFRPQDQQPLGGEAEILAGLTQSLVAEFGLSPRKVFVAGLSAGGAMAAVLGATHPDLYAAAGVHSGLPPRSAHDVNTAFAAMRGQHRMHGAASRDQGFQPRLIIFHGSADQTVSPVNASQLWKGAVQSKGSGEVLELRVSSGGRNVDRRIFSAAGVASVEEWIIQGSGHSWSGGNPKGSFTDASGPNASAEMVRFFLAGG